MKELNKKLGEKIRALRKELGYKAPEELAEKINIPAEDIKAYEKGTKEIPMSFITRLCIHAGIEVRYFLRLEKPKFSYRGKGAIGIHQESKILTIYDGLKLLKEARKLEDNRIDYIEENNPEIAAHRFIKYYGLKTDGFNTYKDVVNILLKRDIFVFFLPLDVSALVSEEDPFFIVINSKEPEDRWSFSLLHEVGHLIAPPHIKRDHKYIEKYADIFAGAVLIPKEYRYELWTKLGKYIEGRNYITFFKEVRKLNKLVSPEAVFLNLIREFMPEPDYGRFRQFKKKAEEIRRGQKEQKSEYYIPDEYKHKIREISFITEARKKELAQV